MKFLLPYLKASRWFILGVMLIKLLGTLLELMLPYVLEHLIDHVAPLGETAPIFAWGALMMVLAILVRVLNVTANRLSVRVARNSTYAIRRDLFHTSLNLSGSQMDAFGLPSITSRMTSDSYNVQSFIQSCQTLGIRAPIMLLGGIFVTLTMDAGLASILCIMAPIMIVLVVGISMRGIPLFDKVQQGMDDIVRVMRENITGIRVVKALSKEPYEIRRFQGVNETAARRDMKASIVMSLPGPVVTLFLNIGLTLVVYIGARRVNAGVTQPGVILAFLTYFNMILMGVMGLNRIFMAMSKANASAQRIQAVIGLKEELGCVPESEAPPTDRPEYVIFQNVSFNYGAGSTGGQFAGEHRQQSLSNISFAIPRGGSLGIIGATGCGKTTILNLLMRFYDCSQGRIFVDGRDVRTYDKDQLHRKFGVVFQNDVVFADTLAENILFGREVDAPGLQRAAEDARALDFIQGYEDGFQHKAAIHGANLSGGQRQRILIARALAAEPEILILDDASSALDYRTDAALRRAIRERYSPAATIVVAQRVSSIMSLDQILMLEEGELIGCGTHAELMASCPAYREIYRTQMGEAV